MGRLSGSAALSRGAPRVFARGAPGVAATSGRSGVGRVALPGVCPSA